MWLLEILKLHMWLLVVTCIIFLLDSFTLRLVFIFIKSRFNFAVSKLLGMRAAQLVVLLLKHTRGVDVTSGPESFKAPDLFFFFFPLPHLSCLNLGDSSQNSTVRKLFYFYFRLL